ncbi:MAG: Eco57I restriction-modification methylase domain-containing protein [Bacteroidales bacterium]|jgi:site-specific DNA-methyltransferase (adenine-specific)|nr:Eco57I restriction-modification methylase domain-containing protein [Bacteroidales bacterium]
MNTIIEHNQGNPENPDKIVVQDKVQTKNTYNPDVLSCLANLSNDEVFTPPALANQILDILPASLWSNPEARFLDPVCKSGVFLREIAKRLMEGLKDIFPDEQERTNHVFTKQLFGMGITEITAIISRRSLYCSKVANSKYSVCSDFADEQGNIRYERMQHTFKNGKCLYCSASQEVYDRTEDAETYAYPFIHEQNLFENMKFDVIIGNPPYQLSDGSGGSSDSAIPIYNKFIEQAIALNSKYLVMIIPSKWMVGGRGLDKFRETFSEDKRVRIIVDYENSSDCFQGLHIDSGVCYFLWDRNYCGDVEYTYIKANGKKSTIKRSLKNSYYKYIVRDSEVMSILEKVSKGKSFATIVSNVRPFGIRKYLFNEPERYPDFGLQDKPFPNSVKVYGVKGIKGGAKRVNGYIKREKVPTRKDDIDKFKLFFTTSYSTNAFIPPAPIVAGKGEICTETFLLVGPFENQIQQGNCLNYISTNFFRTLLFIGKGSMQVTSEVFALIPLQDFSEAWTDEKLYKKYNLSQEEIDFIESMVKPMELN